MVGGVRDGSSAIVQLGHASSGERCRTRAACRTLEWSEAVRGNGSKERGSFATISPSLQLLRKASLHPRCCWLTTMYFL